MAAPTRADRFRPAELVGLASVIAVFTGVVVFMSTREWTVSVIFLGGAFVVALVVLAMLALATGPIGTETDLRGNSPTAPVVDPRDDPAESAPDTDTSDSTDKS